MNVSRALGWMAGCFVCSLAAGSLCAQTPADTLRGTLPEVRVEAARSSTANAPYSIDVLERPEAARLLDPGATLASALRLLPGVYLADRENPALGERLVVRGLGYRSAFGVRGVQVVLDGIPLTLPDGQAVLNVVDPAFVREAEVVRGPASALWGNSSGGVVFLNTLPRTDAPTVALRLVEGSNAYRRAEGEFVTRGDTYHAGLAASYTRSDGYRFHSGYQTFRGRAFAEKTFSPRTFARVLVAYENTPEQQHPGALTSEELEADRRQAETRYVTTQSGKKSQQAQAGLTLVHALPAATLHATVFGQMRRLDNPLPFAYIDLDRAAGGFRSSLDGTRGGLGWTVGLDAGWQRDARTNAPNEDGERGEVTTLDQKETVRQIGGFARLRMDAAALGVPHLSIEAALRADQIAFRADDHLLTDGDASGSRTLGAVSPMAGATYRLGNVDVFASVATSFETPTTTELANRPDGQGGFNPSLQPQRAVSVEIGVRGREPDQKIRYDAALYAMRVRDGLAPFEGESGRTFYRNVQQTRHAGLETSATWQPSQHFHASAAYTLAHLTFGPNDAVVTDPLENNALPGVPRHQFAGEIGGRVGRFDGLVSFQAHTGLYGDDANTTRTDGRAWMDVSAGYTRRISSAEVRPFARITNVLDEKAVGSVAINARGGRYFEPAATRQFYFGLRVAW